MITYTFQDAFCPQWVHTHLPNPTHELTILRRIVPWQSLMDRLAPFYHTHKGRHGHSLRTTVAIVARLRQLSDRKVIEAVKENRYLQYFCNVPDPGLMTFMDPSTLCCFRKRLGHQGIAIIEEEVFDRLKWAKVIEADMMLMDSTVLESSILYPTDVRLLFHAFKKMAALATQAHMDPWWEPSEIKKLWRAYHVDKRKQHLPYICVPFICTLNLS